MEHKVDLKRIGIFLAFAFAIAWATALVIALTGGLAYSPELIAGSGITLAVALLSGGYMWAPALAHLLTRLITREGRQDMSLRPHLKRGWPYWLAAWFVPAICTIVGIVVYFLLFPGAFDRNLTLLQQMLKQSGAEISISPWMIAISQTLTAVLFAPFLNGLFTFGEEFGWRGYLLNKLRPLGGRKAVLWLGLIWGVWHWPAVAMGLNYGQDYAGAPWLGMLLMIWFTTTVGIFLAWVTLRGGSVWPAVIGHAAVNGISNLGMLFILTDKITPLLGPAPVGIIGSVGWSIVALWLMLNDKALRETEFPVEGAEPALLNPDSAL